MKIRYKITCMVFTAILAFTGCENFLDTKIDIYDTPENIATNRGTIWSFGFAFYAPMTYGFEALDNNLFAAASDEAQQTAATGNVYYFNKGTITADANPLSHLYQNYYEGIRAANFFLEYAKNGEYMMQLNRDTINNAVDYHRDLLSLKWFRAEANIAKAYYYSELIKMYGGVPIVISTMDKDENVGQIARSSYDEVVNYIVTLIDTYKGALQEDFRNSSNISDQDGRFTLAAALAIKVRTLLYAASPLNNPSNDKAKWERAASAAHDLIVYKNYTMPEDGDYEYYFQRSHPLNNSDETIFMIRRNNNNVLEMNNYPIATPGGKSGVTPSENLVSAYEYIGPQDPDNPYANRDPRLTASIVTQGSTWNGREIDQSPGGTDDMRNANASKTGYYLKKFMTDELNLIQGEEVQHQWVVFRYAEVLLNYAEAMNEAYGPDVLSGYTLTARQALTQVRRSASTSLPDVITTDVVEFRNALKHERRVELAFEDHRYWDLLRWKDAETVLNLPLKGVSILQAGSNYTYQVVNVAERKFLTRNYYLPFSRSEIVNSNGKLVQNSGY